MIRSATLYKGRVLSGSGVGQALATSLISNPSSSYTLKILEILVLMTTSGTARRPMLSFALIIGDPRRRGKNRPPVYLQPTFAGTVLLGFTLLLQALRKAAFYPLFAFDHHLCQIYYMSRPQFPPYIIVRSAIASDVSTFPHMKVRTWYDTYKAFGVPDWELNAPPQEKEFAEGFEARIRDPTRITGM
jgi:hypothetical protein